MIVFGNLQNQFFSMKDVGKLSKARTANKRFGVMRGVCSRKVLREFESFVPVRTFAFPARTPSRQPLAAMREQQYGETDGNFRDKLSAVKVNLLIFFVI